jgi:hypothetical protein
MDDIFDHWIDQSGRTLSLSNIIRDKTGEQAIWYALKELGYAAVAWDEGGVRVRLAADGLMMTLKAVRRPIALEVWDGDAWQRKNYADGAQFAGDIFTAINIEG